MFTLVGWSIEVIALSELVEMFVHPSHKFEDEFGEMSKGDIGRHVELTIYGRFDTSKSDAKGKLLYHLARGGNVDNRILSQSLH